MFRPQTAGVPYVRLKGFVIEQAGNAFSYPVQAVVSPMGGDHWIIEDNVIRQVNTDAINVGCHRWVWGGNRSTHEGWDCIVRRNTISQCGVSGIKGVSPANCLIEDNCLDHIGWQNVELAYDNGGMKLLVCNNVLVRHNLIRNIIAGPGVWLDWDNINCRATQNVVMNVECRGGAFFVEASQRTNWVDHNVIWNVKGNGIFLQDNDEMVAFNNLIGRCADSAVRMYLATNRNLYGRVVTVKRNQVRDNVLVDNHKLVSLSDPDNRSDHNLIANSKDPQALASWQTTSGKDAHSEQIPIQATLSGLTLDLEWAVPSHFAPAFGELPGPFSKATVMKKTIRLFEPARVEVQPTPKAAASR